MNLEAVKDQLIGSLILLVKSCNEYEKTQQTDQIIIDVLRNNDLSYDNLLNSIEVVTEETRKIAPYIHSYPVNYYECLSHESDDLLEDENLQTLRTSMIQGLKEIAKNIYIPYRQGQCSEDVINFIHQGINDLTQRESASLNQTVQDLNSYIDLSRTIKINTYDL